MMPYSLSTSPGKTELPFLTLNYTSNVIMIFGLVNTTYLFFFFKKQPITKQILITKQNDCTLTFMVAPVSSSSFSQGKSRPSAYKLSLLSRAEHADSLLPSSDHSDFHFHTKLDYKSREF